MGFQVEIGNFTKAAGTPPFDQIITLADGTLTPKVLILFTSGGSATGFAVDQNFALGIATNRAAAIQQKTIAVSCDDANGGAAASQNYSTKAIAWMANGASTITEAADLKSFAAGSFTLTWTTGAAAGVIYGYLVMGGSDITDANVTEHTMPIVTGNQAFTGVGFQPDFQMYIQGLRTAVGAGTAGYIGWGWARADSNGTSNIQQVGHSAGSRSHATTHTCKSWQKNTDCLMGMTSGGAAELEASLVSFNASGMTLNFTDAPASAWLFAALSIKGPKFAVGTTAKSTNTSVPVDQAIASGLSFSPAGYLMCSMKPAASTAIQANSNTGFGGATGTTKEFSIWANSQDAANPYIADHWTSTTKALGLAPNNPTVVDAECDHKTMDAGGATVTWTANDATASDIAWVMFGTTADTALSAAISGVGTVAAAIVTAITAAASIAGSGLVAGVLATAITLASAVSGSAATQGDLTTQIRLAGDVAGSGTVQADLSAPQQALLQASISGTGAVAGGLTTQIPLGAAVQGTGTVAGALTTAIPLATSVNGVGTVQAALTAGQAVLEANISGTGTVGGALTTQIPLASGVSGSGTVAGGLTTSIPLASSVSGTGTVAAGLTTQIRLASAVSGSGVVAGGLTTQIPVAAAVQGTGTVAGAITTSIPLAASANGTATVAAALTTPGAGEIQASISGTGTVTGALTVPIVLRSTVTGTAIVAADLTRNIGVQRQVIPVFSDRPEQVVGTDRPGHLSQSRPDQVSERNRPSWTPINRPTS